MPAPIPMLGSRGFGRSGGTLRTAVNVMRGGNPPTPTMPTPSPVSAGPAATTSASAPAPAATVNTPAPAPTALTEAVRSAAIPEPAPAPAPAPANPIVQAATQAATPAPAPTPAAPTNPYLRDLSNNSFKSQKEAQDWLASSTQTFAPGGMGILGRVDAVRQRYNPATDPDRARKLADAALWEWTDAEGRPMLNGQEILNMSGGSAWGTPYYSWGRPAYWGQPAGKSGGLFSSGSGLNAAMGVIRNVAPLLVA